MNLTSGISLLNDLFRVIDILGGPDLNVEQDMNYDDLYEELSIHLNKGYSLMILVIGYRIWQQYEK
ncbi:hypothetical protein Ga0466249_000448 [Sporomusaceae bacterium BoRhaA]|uniref:hypothetical protein n=1 Tax=Pelorhabdus rhamnosifermentans TaxID=2772457 RepID=UPI001C0603A8|nr:hypothetical protein [Pelorhabdus rhamnosifermentans]MBU2699369.1 hypothetical protein [Pelorhabdus rhamnosifermentans]